MNATKILFPRRSFFGKQLSRAAQKFTACMVAALFACSGTAWAGTTSYAKSNAGIKNIQASSPTFAGATDKNSNCVFNAAYNNHRSESWIAVDPTKPESPGGDVQVFLRPGVLPVPHRLVCLV